MWPPSKAKPLCTVFPSVSLSSSSSPPLLLQNTTSCFELTFQAYGHPDGCSAKCLFSVESFCHLKGNVHILFPHFPSPTTQLSVYLFLALHFPSFHSCSPLSIPSLLRYSTPNVFWADTLKKKKSLFSLSYRMSLPFSQPSLSPVPLHGWPLKQNMC